jgi:hypothetical protein
MWLDQCFEALFNRIGAGPLLAKPIGVVVRGGFQHGIKCKQMQCLLGSIFHSGDGQRELHTNPVNLWDGLRSGILFTHVAGRASQYLRHGA